VPPPSLSCTCIIRFDEHFEIRIRNSTSKFNIEIRFDSMKASNSTKASNSHAMNCHSRDDRVPSYESTRMAARSGVLQQRGDCVLGAFRGRCNVCHTGSVLIARHQSTSSRAHVRNYNTTATSVASVLQ
jgi:hypothetical protein